MRLKHWPQFYYGATRHFPPQCAVLLMKKIYLQITWLSALVSSFKVMLTIAGSGCACLYARK